MLCPSKYLSFRALHTCKHCIAQAGQPESHPFWGTFRKPGTDGIRDGNKRVNLGGNTLYSLLNAIDLAFVSIGVYVARRLHVFPTQAHSWPG